ncbi:MAG: PorT family protein [Saprospiraceae bacterium]|nr:PorT family protein [Saprospiraceae bacterium]
MMKAFFKITLFSFALMGFTHLAEAQINFGVKAGLNLANMYYSDDFDALDPKMIPTFQVGVIADINLSDNFAVQPGLLLVGKGTQQKEEAASFEYYSNPYYLQVPVNFLYKNNLFYAGLGPYVGFGLFGKEKVEFPGTNQKTDISFGSSLDDSYSALDFGANVEAGINAGKFRVGVGYALGLANTIPGELHDQFGGVIRHGVASFNVAYMFGGE